MLNNNISYLSAGDVFSNIKKKFEDLKASISAAQGELDQELQNIRRTLDAQGVPPWDSLGEPSLLHELTKELNTALTDQPSDLNRDEKIKRLNKFALDNCERLPYRDVRECLDRVVDAIPIDQDRASEDRQQAFRIIDSIVRNFPKEFASSMSRTAFEGVLEDLLPGYGEWREFKVLDDYALNHHKQLIE